MKQLSKGRRDELKVNLSAFELRTKELEKLCQRNVLGYRISNEFIFFGDAELLIAFVNTSFGCLISNANYSIMNITILNGSVISNVNIFTVSSF